MNDAHWHLVLNHLPIVFPIVGLLIMLGGFILKSDLLKRAALCIFVLSGLAAWAASFTGERAEEVVEQIAGIGKKVIHEHEEMAGIFVVLSWILGGISLIGIWASRRKVSFANLVIIGATLFSLVVLFYGKETGTTGGEIRHTEIRDGYVVPAGDDGEEDDDHD